MEGDGMSDTPEYGPTSEADFEIFSEVECCLLTVIPRARGVTMTGQFSDHEVEAVRSKGWDKRKWMRARRYEAQVVGWLCVTGEGERTHRRWPPVELLLADGERVAGEGDAAIQFHCALAFECRALRNWQDLGIIGTEVIQCIDELIDGRGFCRIAGAVLQLLSVIEEPATVVGAKRESGDCAAASTKRTAEVVPPGLTKVVAVRQGWTCDCSEASVDGLQAQRIAVERLRFEFGVKVGDEKVSLRKQVWAGCIGLIGDALRYTKLPEALHAGPR